jgi:hypothetical protein
LGSNAREDLADFCRCVSTRFRTPKRTTINNQIKGKKKKKKEKERKEKREKKL